MRRGARTNAAMAGDARELRQRVEIGGQAFDRALAETVARIPIGLGELAAFEAEARDWEERRLRPAGCRY